jgi:ABC-type Mn2+/Zn2+ transport system ATPase subunit
MKAILGLLPVQAGQVFFRGKRLQEMDGGIGYVPQRFGFDRTFPITVSEFLELACPKHCPHTHLPDRLKEVGLTTSILRSRLGDLSGGQLQRVLIAYAIARNPAYLFLDEPSAGIDVAGEETFYEILKHLKETHGTTIILVSHDLSVVSDIVDNVICLNRKMLCFGPPARALTPKTLAALYGKSALYEHHAH